MHTTIWIAALLVVVALILLKLAFSGRPAATTRLRYKRVDLFNSTEHAFLMSLRREAPPHIAVLAKVRVADLLSTLGNDIPAFNRIARKHVDFVLYSVQNRTVLRAIELDGPTHTSKRSVKSDAVKNSCFASARIPLTRVLVADANNHDILRSLFVPALDVENAYDARHGQREPVARAASVVAPVRPNQSPSNRRQPNHHERRP